MHLDITTLWRAASLPGKGVIVFLALMGLYLCAISFERLITLYRARRRSAMFVPDLQHRLREGDLKAALGRCTIGPQSPMAVMIEAALNEYLGTMHELKTRGRDDVDPLDVVDAVNRAIERAREREIAELRKGLGGLATIASSVPFVGLFGTVIGIIHVFATMNESGTSIHHLAGGIGEALVTTALGLLVAIPAVMVFNYLTNSIEGLVVDMNEIGSELISFMLREGRKVA